MGERKEAKEMKDTKDMNSMHTFEKWGHTLQTKRIYEPEAPDDGNRILVDRLWPRGISKVRADLNAWDKDIAPVAENRKAFHDGKESYEDFARIYRSQLDHDPEADAFVHQVEEQLHQGNVTLLYGSKDADHNNAGVLLEWLKDKLEKEI